MKIWNTKRIFFRNEKGFEFTITSQFTFCGYIGMRVLKKDISNPGGKNIQKQVNITNFLCYPNYPKPVL